MLRFKFDYSAHAPKIGLSPKSRFLTHTRPLKTHSFWSAPRIATSGRVLFFWACAENSFHTLNQSEFSDLTLRMRRVTESPWVLRRTRFLLLTKRRAASGPGDENMQIIDSDCSCCSFFPIYLLSLEIWTETGDLSKTALVFCYCLSD